ncbi:hypothetical protein Desaci_3295 [Desulfosporosinus acidiphilus SJ4]|uniref:Uncharacterized protein n=1 Tax=Desulfosporosinus acidiphilus (strain DSM 22704 / JCM 16185 / SJ4) TaxID=646529 RepID=I4D8R7_DESAJ|nr:hypothetical protein [Desulfosporosinus acidiphilus]AFM42191.1 hypothetical protein Desaci_3295 [Desulfosporosinus acidiphilus SJ4]
MVILKRLFFKPLSVNSSDLDNTMSQETSDTITMDENLEAKDHALKAPGTLMSKLLRSQAEPEFLYENEAWSPEREPVRLFHKGTHYPEGQNLDSSNPQE